LHDAAEAYLPDVPRPLKALLKIATPQPGGRHKLVSLSEINGRILAAAARQFGLRSHTIPREVVTADDRVMATEYAQLFPPESREVWQPDAAPFDWLKIDPLPPSMAADQWLRRFRRLTRPQDSEEPTP